MTHYYGIRAILARLNYADDYATWTRLLQTGLPAYQRRRGPRTVWYTNESMLLAWELARARQAVRRVAASRVVIPRAPGQR